MSRIGLCAKGLSQGWGRFVTSLRLELKRGMPGEVVTFGHGLESKVSEGGQLAAGRRLNGVRVGKQALFAKGEATVREDRTVETRSSQWVGVEMDVLEHWTGSTGRKWSRQGFHPVVRNFRTAGNGISVGLGRPLRSPLAEGNFGISTEAL